MKKLLLLCTLLCATLCASAQSYTSLDPANPIAFDGKTIGYAGRTIELGPKAFFLDGRLSDAQTGDHVFNTIQSALEALTDGTESEPMTLYIAPWVYWVDDPDDPAIRKATPNAVTGRSTPFGAVVECEWLHFVGLTPDPVNVVLASNRGQTHGSEGNFTMFNFIGDGLMADNLTFGNYCNIDLEFPLAPELNRERRASAIVQAQLAFSNADKALARNCRFVSRLNLCPFTGARRLLFVDCHFETTDDALAGTGVYLHCDFDIYGDKPFGSTAEDGAVLLDCDIRSYQTDNQYFTKRDNAVILIDSRIQAMRDPALRVGWSGGPRTEIRCYEFGNTLNGKPLHIDQAGKSVDLKGTDQLHAFRVEYEGRVVYNTYNLLRGDDDWDPMGVKEQILMAGDAAGMDYTNMPVYLRVTPRTTGLRTGDEPMQFTATAFRHGLYEMRAPSIRWSADAAVTLAPNGQNCLVTAADVEEATPTRLHATTSDGLVGTAALSVSPAILPAPKLAKQPTIAKIEGGKATLDYALDLDGRADHSIITWYRCTDKTGADPLEVAVSRMNEPLRSYTLTAGDAGRYLMARIEPRSSRSNPGEAVTVVTKKPVKAGEIVAPKQLQTDFRNFPTANQPAILPGAWTVGGFKPADTDYYNWQATADRPNWEYRPGQDGTAGITALSQVAQGARMLYTPVEGSYGDMLIELTAAPAKQGAQGFGSATGQYMDVFIQYDTRTLSGYGLRITRTPKFGDAVDVMLMRYENGISHPLTSPVSTDAFRTACSIRVEVAGDRLSAEVTTTAAPRPEREGIVRAVRLETTIIPNAFGGLGVQHTGTANANATWLTDLRVIWK